MKAAFCPKNPPLHPQPQAPSFITCEGLILSAAVALLFINHSQGSIKLWRMVDTALSGYFSGVGSCSRVRPGRSAVSIHDRCLSASQPSCVLHRGCTSCFPATCAKCALHLKVHALFCRSWPCLTRSPSCDPRTLITFYLFDPDWDIKNVILSAAALGGKRRRHLQGSEFVL